MTKRRFSVLSGLVLLAFVAGLPLIQACLAKPLSDTTWLDDFTTQDPRWDWVYHSGSGYHILQTLTGGITTAELGITTATTHTAYSDSSLHETSPTITNGVVAIRLRTNDDNGLTIPGAGTRGWGFFNGKPDPNHPELPEAAWFWSASPESDATLRGFKAQVIRGGLVVFNQDLYTTTLKIDMTQWHTYRVELSDSGTAFFVDGSRVAATSQRPNSLQRIEFWEDNYAVQLAQPGPGFTTSFLTVSQNQKLWVDWASFTDLPFTPTPSGPHYFVNLPFLIR
ncbi:MAG TPA: hypothetical protein VF823_03400 [Anaerolineales bacterium]